MSLVADYTDSENSDGEQVEEGTDKNLTGVNSKNDDNVVSSSSPDRENGSKFNKIGSTNVGNLLVGEVQSSDSESGDEDDDAIQATKPKLMKLDNPFRTVGDVNVAKEDSVFRNPFRDKEEQKIAVLERHVKMTDNPVTALTINGKKICWNYRKRKCYLGSKCPYAHDSDVPLTEQQQQDLKAENDLHRAGLVSNNTIGVPFTTTTAGKPNLPGTASAVAGGYDSSAFFSSDKPRNKKGSDDEVEADKPSSKKVRVGLRNGLVPPNKALKLYHKTKDRNC